MGIQEANRHARNRVHRWGRGAWLLMALVVIFSLPLAQALPGSQGFDHFQTGFPLTGQHARIECESCHVAGIFKGTPRQCKSCHTRGTRTTASLPPADTIHNLNQQADCDTCHKTSGFAMATFEHMGITSGCLRCHKAGGGAQSAPIDDIHRQAPGADCSECHRSTDSFASGALLDHSGFSSGCATAGCHARDKGRARSHTALAECQSCHSYPSWTNVRMNHSSINSTQCKACHVRGGNAMASPSDQFHASVATQDCSACHSTATFAGATIDHGLITTGCGSSSCHAADRTRAPNHAGLSSCESCHSYPSWPSVTMNHNAIGTTQCKACHRVAGTASAPPADQRHASIGSLDCSACHSTVTFVGGGVDHSVISTGCGSAGCHATDRTRAPNHTGLSSCESCHRYPSWLSVTMNHSAIGTTLCKSCHTAGGIATASPSDQIHANIGSQDCSACHSTATFAGARVDHSTITTGCGASGCHAADRTRAPVHAALISCESCHRYPSWPSVSMNHNAIGATRCDSCHLYGSNAGLGRGAPNDSRHRNAQSGGRDCSSCHNTRNFD